MKIGRVHLLALAAGGCVLLGAGTAGAGTAAVQCGTTLTSSTALKADLVQCPGTGLVIGADNITVDLGGHTISGTNAAGGEGIANDGHAGVRIVNGKISDFRLNGVGIRGAQNATVSRLTIRRIGAGGAEGEPVSAGIAIVDSPNSQVIGNDVANDVTAYQSDGVDILNSHGSLVRGNTLSHNAWNGLVLIGSANSKITGNELDANANNGVEVNGESDSVWVARNRADRNTSLGIVVGDLHGARVTANTARGNDTGIFFFDLHDSVISDNTTIGNGTGLALAGGQFGSDGNTLTRNDASRNLGTGIALTNGADKNTVSHNTANANQGGIDQGGGIFIGASTGNALIGNVASNNNDSGIEFGEDTPGDSAGNSLKGNAANKNRNHGIDAVTGTVDGGGNHASGNAVQPQCNNVVCS